MFSGGKKWIKKMLKRCYSFSLYLLCLFFVLCFSYTNVSAIAPDTYNVRYSVNFGSAGWHSVNQNEVFNIQYLYNYEWKINSVYYAGNFVNIHFETNVVMRYAPQDGRFHNTNLLTVNYCGSNGVNLPIRGSSVTHHVTSWTGRTPSYNTDTPNQTLTIYADLVLDGATQGATADLYCNVGLRNNWAFAADNTDDTINSVSVYFEQSPTTLSFTSNQDEALQQQQISALNTISDNLDRIANSNDEMEVYDKEQSDLQDKESELNTQSGDLGLSANTPSNPFLYLFDRQSTSGSLGSSCATLNRIPAMFGASSFQFCSPYPNTYRNVIQTVGTFFLVGLILRLYFKHLHGGFN